MLEHNIKCDHEGCEVRYLRDPGNWFRVYFATSEPRISIDLMTKDGYSEILLNDGITGENQYCSIDHAIRAISRRMSEIITSQIANDTAVADVPYTVPEDIQDTLYCASQPNEQVDEIPF
jgi:hypothetical protein